MVAAGYSFAIDDKGIVIGIAVGYADSSMSASVGFIDAESDFAHALLESFEFETVLWLFGDDGKQHQIREDFRFFERNIVLKRLEGSHVFAPSFGLD